MSYEPFSWGICSICGNKYLKKPGSIYTVKFAGRSYPCCSYNCYMIGVHTKENVAAERQGKLYAKMLIEAGKSGKEDNKQ